MKTNTRWITLFIALMLVLSAAGCGGGAQQSGPVTIHMLAMEQAGATVDEMNAIVKEFNEKNPNISVQIDYVAYDALHDKIVTSLASNPPAYDIFLVDDIWYAEFADKGYVLDVTDRITQDMKDKVFDASWDITTVNDKTYGMPWLLDQKYFFYNEKILADAGISAPPKTWEEALEQAQTIKDQGLVEFPLVWSWAQAEAAICDWVTLLYGNGGAFLDADGKVAFNSEIGVKTLEWMLGTVDSGLSNPASVSYLEEDVRNVFSQGKAAFATNWNYMYDPANFQADQSTITGQVKMALMPAFSGSGVESATINGSMGMSIAASSANKDAAWAYVEYLTSEDVQNRYSAHLLPIWESSFEGEAGQKLASASEVTAVTVPMFQEQFPFAKVRPKVPFYPEGSKALQLALQQALTKQLSPKEALDQAAATWQELMK